MKRGVSIYAQTLLLLVISLIATQVASVALILSLPQPRPDFVALSELADMLAPQSASGAHGRKPGPPAPLIAMQPSAQPPAKPAGMIDEVKLTRQLAVRIGADQSRVRLYFSPDRGRWLRFSRRDDGEVVPLRRGEPLFTRGVIAAVQEGNQWHAVRSAPRPWLSEWQRMPILLFFVSLITVLPLAWLFARRLSRPIRSFAAAADRMGRDASAPRVPIEGPTELQISAQALNAMQARIGDYLRERTAMIGAIAHDLRTPLARIAFRMESADDMLRQAVQSDIEQMRSMIAATMDFAKGAGRRAAPERIWLDCLLLKIVAQCSTTGGKVFCGDLAQLQVLGDRISLQRLFQNLIDNALAYGGEAEIAMTQQGSMAVVTIRDSGPGVPEESLGRLFDPFYRLDPSRSRETGGVGLGLTIARMITTDHGGSISLANRCDGTTGLIATVSLPLPGQPHGH